MEILLKLRALDPFSRKVIGWVLSRSLKSDLCIGAVQQVLAVGSIELGLVHHSDRAVQYACHGYTQLLIELGIAINMSRKGNPYDNAFVENWMKTLKPEEVSLSEYQHFSHSEQRIAHFIQEVHNKKRLHSTLGYVSPELFEANFHSSMAV